MICYFPSDLYELVGVLMWSLSPVHEAGSKELQNIEFQFGSSLDLGSLSQHWRRRAAKECDLICTGLRNKEVNPLLY